MVNYVAGQRVDIKENEEFEITCKVSNAKPKADIVWYRNDIRFQTGTYLSGICAAGGTGYINNNSPLNMHKYTYIELYTI